MFQINLSEIIWFRSKYMKNGGSGLLILIVGLLIIYLAVTGRYKCFTDFIACIGGAKCECDNNGDATTQSKVVTPLQPLKPIFPQ